MMTHPPAGEVLDREFLALRARLIDLAAGLDRLDRGDGSLVALADDPRYRAIVRSLELLTQPGPDRSARVQEAFSLEYDPQWRANLMGGDQ